MKVKVLGNEISSYFSKGNKYNNCVRCDQPIPLHLAVVGYAYCSSDCHHSSTRKAKKVKKLKEVVKIIRGCEDCKIEFEVLNKGSRKIRCSECQKVREKDLKQKQRERALIRYSN